MKKTHDHENRSVGTGAAGENSRNGRTEVTERLKKQLIGTGAYLILAVVVVAVTVGGVKTLLPDPEELYPRVDTDSIDRNLEALFPAGSTPSGVSDTVKEKNGADEVHRDEVLSLPDRSSLPELTSFDFPTELPVTETETEEGIAVFESPAGVTAAVIEEAEEAEEAQEAEETEDEGAIPTLLVRPCEGYITREYAIDELLYTPTMNDFRTHGGIDIAAEPGSPVVAFANGTVSDIYDDPLMGKTVVISHTGGLVSCYRNLSEAIPQNITVGARVLAGQTIGGVGESAAAESADVPHLHFELFSDSAPVDPREYLK